jgi:Vanadium chloroperoxidase N-terminal domain/PAP2 superfamily
MDHILYWNSIALEANRRDFSNLPDTVSVVPEQGGPTLSSRALAIIHLAMYDAHAGAVNAGVAIPDPSLPRYLSEPVTPTVATDAAAAVAGAAHTCLVTLYPRQRSHFDDAIVGAGLSGATVANSRAFGTAVAKAMLMDRMDDPSVGAQGYMPSNAPLRHRADPSMPKQGYHAPFYGERSKAFAVEFRHDLLAPSTLSKKEVDDSVEQVRAKGIAPGLMGTLPKKFESKKRSIDETVKGVYWAYDGPREIGTPPRLYNQIVREVAMKTLNPNTGALNTVDQNARLFALVNAAMGDAGIFAWDEKYKHNYWRPVLGIRELDSSMGPAAPDAKNDIDNDCDPEWLPIGAPVSNSIGKNSTPPFPAYPSGHATFGAAAFQIVRLFYLGKTTAVKYEPDMLFKGLSFVSDELNGMTTDNTGSIRPRHTRSFPKGLWQMIEENGFSRVYLGVHWSFDAFALNAAGNPDPTRQIGGVHLGLKIAEDVFNFGGGAPKKSTLPPRKPAP